MTAPTRTGSRKDEKITGQNPSIHAATKAGNTLSEPFFTALLKCNSTRRGPMPHSRPARRRPDYVVNFIHDNFPSIRKNRLTRWNYLQGCPPLQGMG